MTKSKGTKKKLTGSILALIACFVMLLGTTFAWFTDTASTNVNTIQAGTLDVDLQVKENDKWVSAEGKTLEFTKATEGADEAVLWEPGCTYDLPELKIINKGNLALKYKIKVTGINGDAKLNEAIEWSINVGNNEDAAAQSLETEQHLGANGAENTLTISGHMKETAGNEYQGLSIKDVAITVFATQDTVEYDSTINEYDKDATYPGQATTSSDDSNTVGIRYEGKTETVNSLEVDHTFNNVEKTGIAVYVKNNADIIMNNVDLNVTDPRTGKLDPEKDRNMVMYVYDGSNLTINSGNYKASGKYVYMMWVQDKSGGATSNVVINGGTFTSNSYGALLAAYNGKITINGGFFDQSAGNANTTLQSLHGQIIVKGGTFVNYNPKNHGNGKYNNPPYLAEGYDVKVEPQKDGKTWYTVVKAK